jgi:hypothetical protein
MISRQRRRYLLLRLFIRQLRMNHPRKRIKPAGAAWPTVPTIDSTPVTTATIVEETQPATDHANAVQNSNGSVLTGNWSMFSYLFLILSGVLAVMAALWLLPRMRIRAKPEVAESESGRGSRRRPHTSICGAMFWFLMERPRYYDSKTAGDLEVKLDEARFYFPEHIQRLLKDIFSASTAKMVHLVERGEVSIDDPEKSAAKAKELNDDDQKLALFYAKLPENFESVLAFKQLSAAPERKSGCADDPACR